MLVTADRETRATASAAMYGSAQINATVKAHVVSHRWLAVPDSWNEIPSPPTGRRRSQSAVSTWLPITIARIKGPLIAAGHDDSPFTRRSEFSGVTMQMTAIGAGWRRR